MMGLKEGRKRKMKIELLRKSVFLVRVKINLLESMKEERRPDQTSHVRLRSRHRKIRS